MDFKYYIISNIYMMVKLYNQGKGKKIKDLAIEYCIAESTIRYWVVLIEVALEKLLCIQIERTSILPKHLKKQ